MADKTPAIAGAAAKTDLKRIPVKDWQKEAGWAKITA